MNKDILKIIAKCLLYSSSGDLIGFSNGNLKFNKKINGILTNKNENFIEESIEKTNETFLRFFNGGLVEGLKIKYYNYIYSYNTPINLIICENIIKYENINDIINNIWLILEKVHKKKIKKIKKINRK